MEPNVPKPRSHFERKLRIGRKGRIRIWISVGVRKHLTDRAQITRISAKPLSYHHVGVPLVISWGQYRLVVTQTASEPITASSLYTCISRKQTCETAKPKPLLSY